MSWQVKLEVIRGPHLEEEYRFQAQEEAAQRVVGRAEDCDIRLPRVEGKTDISRHHCLFTIARYGVFVRDLGSLKGTFVNDELIGQRAPGQSPEAVELRQFKDHELHNGDEVRVGATVFRIAIEARSGEHRDVVEFANSL